MSFMASQDSITRLLMNLELPNFFPMILLKESEPCPICKKEIFQDIKCKDLESLLVEKTVTGGHVNSFIMSLGFKDEPLFA